MSNLKLVSEEIERAVLRSLHDHCPSDTKDLLGLNLLDTGDAMVALSTNDPSILINRLARTIRNNVRQKLAHTTTV